MGQGEATEVVDASQHRLDLIGILGVRPQENIHHESAVGELQSKPLESFAQLVGLDKIVRDGQVTLGEVLPLALFLVQLKHPLLWFQDLEHVIDPLAA